MSLPASESTQAPDPSNPAVAPDPDAGEMPRARRRAIVAMVFVVAGLAWATFLPALHNEFVYDDYPIIVNNPNVTTPGPWYRAWREPYWPRGVSRDKLYRPLTIWSYRANVVLSGQGKPDPVAFRIVNIALHALTAVGVALVARRLTGSVLGGLAAGVLFATHPVHTEAVVTGYGRAEVLAGCFGAWLILRHLSTRDTLEERRPRFHIISSLLFLAAIMSKEHALFLWPSLILIDYWPGRKITGPRPTWRHRLNRTVGPSQAGFALAATIYFLLRFNLFGMYYRLPNDHVRIWESPLAYATPIQHLLTPFRLLWLTLELMVRPDQLCPLWSIPALSLPTRLEPDVIAGMALLGVLLIGVALLFWRRAVTGAMLASLLILLALPTQALPMAHWLFAERWLYLPTVPLAVLAAALVVRIRAVGPAVAVAAGLVLLPVTWSYSTAYANSLIMNREAVRRQPDNYHARRNLGWVLFLLEEYPAAINEANEMLDRFEPTPDAYDILFHSHMKLGDGRRALQALDGYEALKADTPEPLRTEDRRRAEALIQQSALTTSTAPGS